MPGAALLVLGGLPPGGRDLDVLGAEPELAKLRDALRAGAFESRGGEWVRFSDRRAAGVDLLDARALGLTVAQAQALVDRAQPLDGYQRLRRPAPFDTLLLLARRGLGVQAPLRLDHRLRIADAVATEPEAFRLARARSRGWSVRRRLRVLQTAHEAGAASAPLRLLGAAEARRADGAGRARALLAGVRILAPARRRGVVIAISGIDGAGKTTQALALADALADLGHEAVVSWSRITYDPALRRIAAPALAVLSIVERLRRDDAPATPPPQPILRDPGDDWVAGRGGGLAAGLRRRVGLVNVLWASVVAAVHAINQRRELERHLRLGHVVIRDRYVLDAVVGLAEAYGGGAAGGVPGRIVRRVSPSPLVAFWLDVGAEEAHRRQPDGEWSLKQLARHREDYARCHAELGVRRLDATRPPEELAAEIACTAWRALG